MKFHGLRLYEFQIILIVLCIEDFRSKLDIFGENIQKS